MAGLSREATASLKAIKQKMILGLPKEVKQSFIDVTEKNAELLTGTMRSVVPVDPDAEAGYPPGTLRDSVRYDMREGGLKAMVMAGGDEAPYATWVEFGHGGAEPRPFFWPSYRLLRAKIKSNFSRGLTKVIKAFNAGRAG